MQQIITDIQYLTNLFRRPIDEKMQMEYDLNGATTDESHKDHLHLETRSPLTALANLRSTTQPWKRNDMSLNKKDEQSKDISTGGGVAVIIALAVGIALIVLVTVFVVFRKRYGPQYTVWSFISGLCPGADCRGASRNPRTPVSVESGFGCRERGPSRSTKLTLRNNMSTTETANSRNVSRILEQIQPQPQIHSRQSSITIVPNRLSAPPAPAPAPSRDFHPKDQRENKSNQGRRKEPPAALQRTDPRAATERLRALAPTSPSSRLTTSTQSSGPLPSIYRAALDTRNRKRTSYQQDTRSAVDSEDRVLSLPSPSPIFRNILRPSPKETEHLPSHVYQMQAEQPRSPTYETRECASDIALPMLPRSVFSANNTS